MSNGRIIYENIRRRNIFSNQVTFENVIGFVRIIVVGPEQSKFLNPQFIDEIISCGNTLPIWRCAYLEYVFSGFFALILNQIEQQSV